MWNSSISAGCYLIKYTIFDSEKQKIEGYHRKYMEDAQKRSISKTHRKSLSFRSKRRNSYITS
jgi:hypothetical protein